MNHLVIIDLVGLKCPLLKEENYKEDEKEEYNLKEIIDKNEIEEY